MQKIKINADYLGISSSVLCLVHCLVVPFLWISKNIYTHNHASLLGSWEYWIWDYIFGALAFWAVYHTAWHTPWKRIKVALIISYSVFVVGLIVHEPHEIMYAGSFLLIATHLTNLYFCRKNCSLTHKNC
ncbi:MAG: MerC domain-containing protein [Microscillaceae bacterium]|nr:MerC domain-containing protein [Microscillaceae bacterium]MDW8460122.1 MerC domain-containing protein [Cytophagales bacterium]